MESTTSNPHLNVFEPYRELSRGHEDQLTRAAMIVLRLVPLARETLLAAIGEPSQSQLPDCIVDMQATNIVDPSEENLAAGQVQRGRLVSVFLTPDIEPFELAEEITDIAHAQRFDGVLRFDPDLVVVLESKVCRRWARRNGHRVAELNLNGTRFAERRTSVLRWHDLLESWWRLVELGVLGPAEQAALEIEDERLTLHLWPGELKAQAEHLYAGGHTENLCELLDEHGAWQVKPQPLLGFRNAPVRTRVYLTCGLDPAEYARRWQGEDWKHVGAHHRNHILPDLWPWLLERGYASEQDTTRLDPFLHALGRRFAHLRSSMHVARSWDWNEAERLDDEGLLAGEIHDALNRVLGLLEEPQLPSAGVEAEEQAVNAIVSA